MCMSHYYGSTWMVTFMAVWSWVSFIMTLCPLLVMFYFFPVLILSTCPLLMIFYFLAVLVLSTCHCLWCALNISYSHSDHLSMPMMCALLSIYFLVAFLLLLHICFQFAWDHKANWNYESESVHIVSIFVQITSFCVILFGFAGMSWYVVHAGRVFSNWEACHAQVDGFGGACYKKF